MIKERGVNCKVHSSFTCVVRGSFLGVIQILWSLLTRSMVDGDGGSVLKPPSVSVILFLLVYSSWS